MGHQVSLSGNMAATLLRMFSCTTMAERRGVAERAPHLQWRVNNRLLPVPSTVHVEEERAGRSKAVPTG